MEYQSNYIWEKGCTEDAFRVSLVLQHAQVRRQEVLLACVCESENEGEIGITEAGYFTEGLVEWFHRSLLKQCEGRLSDEGAEKLLGQELQRLQRDIKCFAEKKACQEAMSYTGILLWENRFWLFHKGKSQGYLVNRRFQRKNMRSLLTNKEEGLIGGRLQKRLGILLCTEKFLSRLENTEAAEVLLPEGEVSEARLGKRLQELWQENIRRGGTTFAGAVYIWV